MAHDPDIFLAECVKMSGPPPVSRIAELFRQAMECSAEDADSFLTTDAIAAGIWINKFCAYTLAGQGSDQAKSLGLACQVLAQNMQEFLDSLESV